MFRIRNTFGVWDTRCLAQLLSQSTKIKFHIGEWDPIAFFHLVVRLLVLAVPQTQLILVDEVYDKRFNGMLGEVLA